MSEVDSKLQQILAILSQKDAIKAKQFTDSMHVANIVDVLQELEKKEVKQFLNLLPYSQQAEILEYFTKEETLDYLEEFPPHQLINIFLELSTDDRAQIFNDLEEEKQEFILRHLAKVEREDLIKLSQQKPETAGAVMSSDYVTLPPELSVEEAIKKIRKEAPDKETIYTVFVVSPTRKLLGVLSLKDLILAPGYKSIQSMMTQEIITTRMTDGQEQAAKILAKYDLLALPVLDDQEQLVGIITHDDVLDIIQKENTRDLEKLMAIHTHDEDFSPYLKTPFYIHVRRRIFWLVILAIAGLASGKVIMSYEEVLGAMVILSFYIPMISDSGGNSGSQAATVVIRALALDEVNFQDTVRVIWKEFCVGICTSLILGMIAYAKVLFLTHNSDKIPAFLSLHKIAMVIALSLSFQVLTSTLIGATLPLIAKKLKQDPSVVASPAITTIVDMTGLIIYFKVASYFIFAANT
jgi:magnesium transporter